MSLDSVSLDIPFACPACGHPLDARPEGGSCSHCGGWLVPWVSAAGLGPALGKLSLPRVFQSAPRALSCPACRGALVSVLCQGVAGYSCDSCRWLFFDGAHRQLAGGGAPRGVAPSSPARTLGHPALLRVVTDRPEEMLVAPVRTESRSPAALSAALLDALGILVLVVVIGAVLVLERMAS